MGSGQWGVGSGEWGAKGADPKFLIITCVLEVWSETQTRYNHVRTGGSGQRRRLNIITCELEGRRYNHMRAGRSGQRRRLCSSVYVVWDHFKKNV